MGYWESRQAREMYEAMESAEQAAQEIADIYAKASRELNYQITKIYERYRDKFNLNDEDATKLLNSLRDPGDIDELKKKLEGLKGPEAQEILKELESPAYRARIERLENLQSEIDRTMQEVYKQEKKVSTYHYVDQLKDSYYREIYDIKKRTGLDFSFGNVDEKEINRILQTNWSGTNYSKRIWGNTQSLASDLKKQILLGYLTGKAESDMTASLNRIYATGASNARRLVRTESAYVSGQAQAAADKEAGLNYYRILATLDLRTSDICMKMDCKVFAYDDMQVGVNYPPFHPYCRTTVLSEIDDQDLRQLKRRSRDVETGKVKTFSGDITYNEWYKQEAAHNPDIAFKEQVAKHRGQDVLEYERYLERLGKKKVGTISDFREKKYKTPDDYHQLQGEYKQVGIDQRQYAKYRERLGELEELKNLVVFKNLKYTNTERFNELSRQFETFKKIEAKNWSEEFKNKARITYNQFKENGIEMSDHALSRFLSRQEQKGFEPFTIEDIVKQHNMPVNYLQDGRLIRYYNKRALIYSEETGEMVSIVQRNNPKGEWRKANG